MEARRYVFLSHNSADKPAVEAIARRLRDAQFDPWLDSWHLVPGEKWQPALEKVLTDARASVIFVGPSGMGPWQDEELRVAIDRRVNDPAYRVIPVLLPGALRGKRSAVPPFLSNAMWVEFQRSVDEEQAFRRLIAGIEGTPPGPSTETEAAGVNPYRGLRAFDVADSGLFFGREALTGWLVSDIRAAIARRGDVRMLAIVGASGSGKSSLARAGLLAQLTAGAIEGSDRWRYVIFKPGSDPLESLATAGADALGLGTGTRAILKFQDDLFEDARVLHTQAALAMRDEPSGARLLVLVDQFEELFDSRTSEDRRRAFIDNLLHAAAVADGPIVVVATLRADFLGKCAAFSRLAAVLSDGQELVGPMSRNELREAIERPAQLAGCGFEPGLVDKLLDDVEAQPGGLPLLQHALFELWPQKGEGRRLAHEKYERIGGVKGALARRADEIYRSFPPEEQALTRNILLRLTQPGEGTEDTRRRASLAEIVPSAEVAPTIERLVRTLVDQRLLVTEGDTVDVAHEALIQGWPTFREWIEQDRDGLREHRRLTLAAEEWHRLGRDESALYRGLKLDQALAWQQRSQQTLNALEREFLDAGVRLRADEQARRRAQEQQAEAQRQRELEQARREIQRAAVLRRRSRVAVAFAFGMLVFGVVAVVLGYRSHEALLQARAGELATIADSLRDEFPDRSVLLALEARRLAPRAEANALVRAAWAAYRYRLVLRGHEREVNSVQFSPDGKTVVTASQDNTARLWNVVSGKELRVLRGHQYWVNNAQFSPDGKTVLTASNDSTARLWDVASGKELRVLLGHEASVYSAQFSPDGKTVVTASGDKTARLWDVASDKEPRVLRGHDDWVISAQFSPDGKTVVTASGDKTARLWDVASGKELRVLRGHEAGVVNARFSPDGKTVVTASGDGTARLWDVASDKAGSVLLGHKGLVLSAQFSSDGKAVVTASLDYTARLWDVATGKELRVLRGHEGNVLSAQFSPDGKVVVTTSEDDTARLWDVASGNEMSVLRGHERLVRSAQFSPDGRTVATASEDSTARLWDVFGGNEPRVLSGHERPLNSAQFSRDGKIVVTASEDSTARLWDVSGGNELRVLRGHEDMVNSAQFSPDGKTVVTASKDRTARLWDASGGNELRVLRGHEGVVNSAEFSPDGKTVVTASDDNTARLWDVNSGKQLRALRVNDSRVSAAQFSPDGKTVVTASDDNTARLWDVNSGKGLRVLLGHGNLLNSAEFSPDGETVVTASEDETARLWDVTSGKELRVLRGHDGAVYSAQFSPNGQMIVTASGDKTARLWDVASGKELHVLRGHENGVNSAQFSSDGETVVTAGGDATARLWDVATGKELRVLRGHEGAVYGAQFSSNGKLVVTRSVDWTARLWACLECRPVEQLATEIEQRVGRKLSPEERQEYGLDKDP